MANKFFEDMVRIKRESQGNQNPFRPSPKAPKIPLTPVEPERPIQNQDSSMEDKFASVYDVADSNNIKKRGSKYGMWVVAGISVLFLLFALSYLFAGAKIVIMPKTKDVVLNESLTATKDAVDDALSFDVVALSGQESKSVAGATEQDVFKRSKGTVIIYNDFSTAAQKLDVDTRLEGSNGKIYKTSTKLTVPGKSKTGTPGSVEVGIYASEPGVEYDSAPLDFKIFGFKGTPKYTKFYARSKDKITGGFKGKAKVVSDEDKATAIKELTDTLQAKLSKKAGDQIPAGFILFKDAGMLTTEEASPDPAIAAPADGSALVTLKGIFTGVLFDEKKLTQKIAKDVISGFDGADVYIPNIQNIPFKIDQTSGSLKDATSVSFNLSGNAKIVWKLDTEKFMADILGKPKKNFNQILSSYPNIDSATTSVRPIWKMSFPDKAKNIVITVVEPQ